MPQDASPELTLRWTELPIAALHAEIARRQATGERPSCGSGANTHKYHVGAHVAALFLILFLSTLACSFPIIVRRFPKLPVPNFTLFISRHFGTGVLIATAFVHLLPTAYTNLTDPCLPPFWNEVYPAMAGFIAMVSVLVVVGIEMFFATRGGGHSHHVDFEQLRGGSSGGGDRHGHALRPDVNHRTGSFKRFRQGPIGLAEDEIPLTDSTSPYVDVPAPEESVLNKPLPRTPEIGREADDDSDLDLNELDDFTEEAHPLTGASSALDCNGDRLINGHARRSSRKISVTNVPDVADAASPTPNANEQRAILQCLMLEAGILFHSVFIGMAVSVSTGSAFVVLLVAISFHQTFEGLALGSRIAAIASFSTNSPKPWLMSLMYGVTTPIGQAIGLGVQGLYDPESQLGLLMVGIVNAISSGLLLYAGLVQLLAEDFLSDQSYIDLHGRRRLQACAAVVSGSMLMAFVGAFA